MNNIKINLDVTHIESDVYQFPGNNEYKVMIEYCDNGSVNIYRVYYDYDNDSEIHKFISNVNRKDGKKMGQDDTNHLVLTAFDIPSDSDTELEYKS